jgi:hypothetical protein
MNSIDINTPPPAIPHPNIRAASPVVEYPSSTEMAKSIGNSIANFVRGGFSTTDSETLAAREETCRGCEFWDSEALNGTGRCRKCGCSTWAKLRMTTEKCPIGKW